MLGLSVMGKLEACEGKIGRNWHGLEVACLPAAPPRASRMRQYVAVYWSDYLKSGSLWVFQDSVALSIMTV